VDDFAIHEKSMQIILEKHRDTYTWRRDQVTYM